MKKKIFNFLYIFIHFSVVASLINAIFNSDGKYWALFVSLLIIDIYVTFKKEFDSQENSFIAAETMGHSFLSGLLLVNMINYFKNELFDSPLLLFLTLVSFISIFLVYNEDPNENKEPTFLRATSTIIFNFIPAYLIAFFIETSMQKDKVGFINVITFLFGILIIHFIIKYLYNIYIKYKMSLFINLNYNINIRKDYCKSYEIY